MSATQQPPSPTAAKEGFTGLQVTAIVLLAILVTAAASFYLIRYYIFPSDFIPVELSTQEQTVLNHKLRQLGWQPETVKNTNNNTRLEPEAYSEKNEDREVHLSEKELNGLIASNPELARRIAIDLSNDLASAKILIPIPEDFPVMAGQTLRVNAGLELRLDSSRKPVVSLKGVSLMGVPMPNAWLGNIKNVDMVKEYGDQGFWNNFAAGVEDIQIRQGEVFIKLRE